MILDTDLTRHFQILTKFKSLLVGDSTFQDEGNRILGLSIAIKCADVGHGAKGLTLHKMWSRRIIEEFYHQGDMEKEKNIPITPNCDRTSNVSKSQEGFLKYIVSPLFEAFHDILKLYIFILLKKSK